MEIDWLQLVVPLLLIIIMISMGLELSVTDFTRIARMPRSVLVGLAGQLVLLPLLGLAFAGMTSMRPELAAGVVIITACPGGAPSNIFTYLAGANIALSITLTAVSSVLTIVTLPLWVSLGLELFVGDDAQVRLPLLPTIGQLMLITLLPVAAGMLLRARRPELTERWRPRVKQMMAVVLVAATSLIVWSQWEHISRDFAECARESLSLVVIALLCAYGFAKLMGLDGRDSFTISVEVGLQNGALAALIITNLLQRPDLLVLPGTYALLAFAPVAAWTFAYRGLTRQDRVAEQEAG
jgi:BASS family bile acid:Na+ symporter